MSVKILHTADWHIGKKLHEYDLIEDHRLFTDWMLSLIEEREINYLLISGDVFDLANPSQDSLKLYYQFLAKLSQTQCKAIITAGNHDSPALIDAPGDLLNALKIDVIGNVPEEIQNLLFPLNDEKGKTVGCIAALPFLRDRDIRKAGEGESYDDRIQAVRNGITKLYALAGETMWKMYPGIPQLAMGHLYVQGAALSDSEREIQIGNLAGVDEKAFPGRFDYVALGHIHKAQNVGTGNRIRYSGSPIPLSFSEKNYEHKVILLEIKDDKLNQEDIKIESKRKLESFTGTFKQIAKEIHAFENSFSLPALLDLQIVEDVYDPQMNDKIEDLQKQLKLSGDKIIAHIRIKYKNSGATMVNPEEGKIKMDELNPEKIFELMIAGREKDEQQKLMQLFFEIQQQAEESEGK